MSFKERFNKEFNSRMLSLVVIAVLVSATLIWRLYYVQLQDKGAYTSEIKKQIIRPVRIPPIRGRIESSDGKKLADNIPSFSLDFYLPEYRKPGVSKYWTAAENATAFIKQIENRIHQKSLVKTSQLEKILRRREKDLGLTTQKKAKTKEAYELQKRDNRRLRESNKEVIIVFDSLLPGLADQVKNLLLPDYFEWQDNSLLCLVHLINVDQGEGSFTRTAQALIQELDELCLLMNRKHQVNVDEVIRHLYRKPALPFRGLTDLTLEERTILAERKTKRYQVVMTPKRRYAHPYAFSHVTGYTGRRELSTHEDISDYFYFTPELWGRTGLEYVYDKDLAGNGGKELLYVNRSGYAVKQLKSIEDNQLQIKAEHGKNLKLTIDSEAQLIAYELMKEKRGSMVVMDIYTGGLVAMVSVPSFDLTRVRYRDYLKELNAKYPSLSDPQLPKPFYNRAVWEYMPGSIIKPLVAAIALEEGLIDENSVHDCTGAYHFGNKKIRCSNRWGHGEISVEKALEVSCNPFFIDLAVRLGMEKLVSFYEKAGLGKFPIYDEGSSKRLSYERKGILPDVEIDNKIGELTYIAIGQGKVELSPVQACSFIACIANGGKLVKPYIVDEIWDSLEKNMLFKHENYFRGDLGISSKVMAIIHRGMFDVIHGSQASAKMARSKEGITLAGKTGTAQVPYLLKNEDGTYMRDKEGKTIRKIQKNCWFASFAPYESPRYAAVILIEDGNSGGTSAAPLVRQFFDSWSKTSSKSTL